MGNTSSHIRPRVWLITGASTGFGRALAERVLERGDLVVATARKPEQLADLRRRFGDRALTLRMDVTQPREVRSAVAQAVQTLGRIDVLVNNAGYGLMGAIEEPTEDQIRLQFETNVFGALNVLRAVLPGMRQQRRGHILNVSSVGGFTGRPGFGVYNATKFALEGLSEALALEAAHLGIKVTIVEPGAFRTDWAGRSLQSAEPIPDYEASTGETREFISAVNGNQPGDPNKAADAMIAVVNAPNPPLRLVLGWDALHRIRAKLQAVANELDAWEEVTVSTGYSSQESLAAPR